MNRNTPATLQTLCRLALAFGLGIGAASIEVQAQTDGRVFGWSSSLDVEAVVKGNQIFFNKFNVTSSAGETATMECGGGPGSGSRLTISRSGEFEGWCTLRNRRGQAGGSGIDDSRRVSGRFPTIQLNTHFDIWGSFEVTFVAEANRSAYLAAKTLTPQLSTTAWAERSSTVASLPQNVLQTSPQANNGSPSPSTLKPNQSNLHAHISVQEEQRKQKDREDQLVTQIRDLQEKLNRQDKLAIQREAEFKRQLAEVKAAASKIAMQAPSRHALIIGIDKYQTIPKLRNAVADAREMSATLRGFGYIVTQHEDLDERSFKQALRSFRAQVKPGDEIVFFFAGHGIQLAGLNYLLPLDTRGDSEAQVKDESIQLQRILDDLGEARPSFALVIVDACRDNPFKGQGRSIGGRGLSPTAPASGQMILFSAGANQQALDQLGPTDSVQNSVFTRVLIAEMKKTGTSVDRIARNVRSEVVRLAKSVGHDQVPALYDQSIGEFFLSR